jgi:hypothetical protein
MDENYIKILIALIVSGFFTLLVSCGGEGGAGANVPSSGNINSGLTGRLYVNNKEEGVMVDLATGKVVRVPDVRWDETMNYSNFARFSATPNADGSEFVLTAVSCEYHSDAGIAFRHRDCLVLVDEDGNVSSGTVLYEGLWYGAKISDDGQYVAFMYMDEPNLSTPPAQLSITDRNFTKIVSRTTIKHSKNNSGLRWRNFDWAPNGQIVYGYDRSIYITPEYETEGSVLFTLPKDTKGGDSFVYGPKVSPDGSKIAFRYMTNSNFQVKEGNVWVMNIDGTDPHQLVYTPDYGAKDGSTVKAMQIYNDHAWSPDGKYILVTVGGTTGDIGSPGVSDAVYAVPSDSRGVSLKDNGIIKIRTYYYDPDNLSDSLEPYTGTITWLK